MSRRAAPGAVVTARWPVSLAFAAALLGAWQLLAATGRLPDYVLGPAAVAGAVWDFTADGTLAGPAGASLRRLLAGFAAGVGAGVALGLVAGSRPAVAAVAEPVVAVTAPVPKIALFPAVALWLGFTDRAVVLVTALACFAPAFVPTLHGVRGIPPAIRRVAANVGAGPWRTFREVVLPAALPRVVVGLRISLAVAFVMVFAAEAVSSRPGLGFVIVESYQFQRFDRMYAAIAVLGGLGYLGDRILLRSVRRALRGQELESAGGG